MLYRDCTKSWTSSISSIPGLPRCAPAGPLAYWDSYVTFPLLFIAITRSSVLGKASAQPLLDVLQDVKDGTTTILGCFARAPPDSNVTLCVLTRQRWLTLPRPTAAPTAASSAPFNTRFLAAGIQTDLSWYCGLLGLLWICDRNESSVGYASTASPAAVQDSAVPAAGAVRDLAPGAGAAAAELASDDSSGHRRNNGTPPKRQPKDSELAP